jgi:hypothetical protein
MKLTNTVLPVGHRSNSCVRGVTPVYEENRKEKRKKAENSFWSSYPTRLCALLLLSVWLLIIYVDFYFFLLKEWREITHWGFPIFKVVINES